MRFDSARCFKVSKLKLKEVIFLSSQVRQVDLQFTVGEALSCAGAGRLSEAAKDPWVLEEPDLTLPGNSERTMHELIEAIVNEHSVSEIDHVRQVSPAQ